VSNADLVFGALADATRRAILELLREREGMPAGQIAANFQQISRPAVSKHLRVLRAAGLVRSHDRGREIHYALDARPLADVQRDWLQQFVPMWEESLQRLKQRAEHPRAGQ
jgi:DNA-binding transcriptional ArsR family regulator